MLMPSIVSFLYALVVCDMKFAPLGMKWVYKDSFIFGYPLNINI